MINFGPQSLRKASFITQFKFLKHRHNNTSVSVHCYMLCKNILSNVIFINERYLRKFTECKKFSRVLRVLPKLILIKVICIFPLYESSIVMAMLRLFRSCKRRALYKTIRKIPKLVE